MHIKRHITSLSTGVALAAVFAVNAGAQSWTSAYTSATATGNCSALSANLSTEFVIEPVVSRALFPSVNPLRIVKMAFVMNETSGKADLILAEKGGAGTAAAAGRILYYNANVNPPTLTAIGTIPNVYVGFNESGVWGVAVNPKTFAQDNYLYVMYATGNANTASTTNGWRVSRFTLNATTRMMDMASEKIILHIPAATSGRWHTGGSLRFDHFGNLYIATGDNEATAMGPANTADLRGGILRIKPDNSEKGYSIPAGNFGDYWATRWESQGLAARAAAYRDANIVKPEIYVKGSRNPYVFGVDPYREGRIAWSECGPDRGGERAEEHNYAIAPAFSGWPFWVGDGVRQGGYANSYDERPEPTSASEWNIFNPASMTTEVPVNNWAQATGYDTLPPMHKPYTSQITGCAMGGPIVRYNGAVNNPDKVPPHLDDVVLSHNFMTGGFFAQKVNPTTGAAVGEADTVFTMTKTAGQPSLRNLVEFAQGPDGVLYGVDWGAGCCNGDRTGNASEGVVRVRYTGTCQDPALIPNEVTSVRPTAPLTNASWLKVGGSLFSVFAQGPHEAMILDVTGRTLHTFRGEGPKNYTLPALGKGVHVLRVKTTEGVVSRPLSAGL